MNKLLLSAMVGLALTPLAGRGAATTYINPVYGLVSTPPMIDALNFVNYGTFSFGTSVPYETWDTLNFTNLGNISLSPGLRVDTLSTQTGLRTMARTFVNLDAGIISVSDSTAAVSIPPPPCAASRDTPSYLFIWATNIISRGQSPASLIVGPDGWLDMVGTNIDLTRSGLEVTPIWDVPRGDATVSVNNVVIGYEPDLAVYDKYAVAAAFSPTFGLSTSALWNGTNASAPAVPRPATSTAFTMPLPIADSYVNFDNTPAQTITLTNFTGPPDNVTRTNVLVTVNNYHPNVYKGAVFANAPASFARPVVGFGGAAIGLDDAGVTLSVMMSNSVTGLRTPAYLSFSDTLGSTPQLTIITNVIGCPPSGSRPINYTENRLGSSPSIAGNNGYPQANFFTSVGLFNSSAFNNPIYRTNVSRDTVTNATVTAGDTTAHSSFWDNVASRPMAIASGTISNMPGRITLHARTLDTTLARMRAEGVITIQADNVLFSSNAVADCESVSFDLSSTNSTVTVQNMTGTNVNRLRGQTYIWSALWTNLAEVVFTNNFTFSNNVIMQGTNILGTNIVAVPAPFTNVVQVAYCVFMVDGRDSLVTNVPVNVYNFSTHTTNTVLTDSMSVAESFVVNGQSLTLNGNLTFSGTYPANPVTGTSPPITAPQNWTTANAPNLKFFTNNGYMFILNEGHFGDDAAHPYSTFVNTGTIDAESINVSSTYFQNSGLLFAVGPMFLMGGTGVLENGVSDAGGVVEFLAGSVKFNHYSVITPNAIFFMVTNSLFDAGATSANTFATPYGYNLLRKPTTGDLLGTTFQSTAPRYYSVQHTWAGENRGVSVSGYSNDVAVGKLVLNISTPNPGQHYFRGTGANNGMYVDLLDLSGLPNYQSQFQIDPSLTIYYAAARLSFTPPTNSMGVPQQPEEYLDGQYGGHLRWVSSYAGANSSVALVVNGVTNLVNKALRNSKIIDSNGNGTNNYYDSNPFGAAAPTLAIAQVQTNKTPTTAFAITFLAAPKTVYQIEYTTNMPLANWQPLFKYTNSVPTNRVVTISDTPKPAGARRFYRLKTVQ